MFRTLLLVALTLFCSSVAEECDTDTCDNRLDDQSAFIQVKIQKGALKKADTEASVQETTNQGKEGGNCPSGYDFKGLGWWKAAENGGATSHKGAYDVYSCKAKCEQTYGCKAFSLYNFQQCWVYTASSGGGFVGNNANSAKSIACIKQQGGGNCPSGYNFKGLGWWKSVETGGATSYKGAYDVYSCKAKCEQTYGCKAFSLYNFQECWAYTSTYGGFVGNNANSAKSIACEKVQSWYLNEESQEVAKAEKEDDSEKHIEAHEGEPIPRLS